MNDASDNNRYWCHMCSQMICPVMEVEIKCPYCNSGFIEQMAAVGRAAADSSTTTTTTNSSISASNATLSLWAPLLLGMLDEPSVRRMPVVSEENQGENSENSELDSLFRQRLRIAAVLQMLHRLDENNEQSETENNQVQRDGEVIFINPYNNTIILQRTFDIGENEERSSSNGGSTLGDYFFGPGIEALIQHLAENDPNRYGTPPAQKEAVEGLPCVKVEENMSCPVCLEDFEIGSEAKEMPCKHKFHGGCLLPWLEIHSSCPVCRYQLPAEGCSKESNDNSGNSSSRTEDENNGDGEQGRHRRRSRWPFISGLLSLVRSDTDRTPERH